MTEVGLKYRSWEGDSVQPYVGGPFFDEHLARYAFAEAYCANKRVLDLGCGKGYGSYALAQVAKSVTGIDLNDSSIVFARTNYSRPNLRFDVVDATAPEFAGQSFDVIVSFEVLEHLPPAAVGLYLNAVKRLLSSDGCFIISTPNHEVVRRSGVPIPAFHINNLTPTELRTLLNCHFKSVTLIGQSRRRGFLKDFLLACDILNLRHHRLFKSFRHKAHADQRVAGPPNQLRPWCLEDGWGGGFTLSL